MNSPRRPKSSFTKDKSPKRLTPRGFGTIGKNIPITAIELSEKQPRRSFNPTKMLHLVESVRKYGILEPLIVRPLDWRKTRVGVTRRNLKKIVIFYTTFGLK